MPVVPLFIFLVSLTLRIWQIAYPINVDEAYWMLRGASFIRRIIEGDWAGTYLRHHPGVTNMWLTGTGHLISTAIDSLFPNLLGVEQVPYLHSCFSAYSCPIALWIVPRLLQALVTSACMVGVYLLCQQLFNRAIALLAITLLLLEPFFLAYQRFITTDALQADFSILAVLSFLLYLKGKPNRKYLILSSVFLGLATASKIPAIFIVPAVAIWIILIELGLWQPDFKRRGWSKQAVSFISWGVIAIGVIYLVWPTLWVNPIGTIARLYSDLIEESARGDLFYLGEVQTPGIGFYPLILLYRLSPVLQLGAVVGFLTSIVPRWKTFYRSELKALTIVIVVLSLLLSTSDSKIGRYIIVMIPELAILAAAGYWQLGRAIAKGLNKSNNFVGGKITKSPFMLLFLGFIQAVGLIYLTPYYVSYYNPLFGGASVARNYIHIGIGEGLDKAARIFNRDAGVESLKVASWYNWAFTPYFKGKAASGWSQNPVELLSANRVILYINQIQRNLPAKEFVDYFLEQKPLETISLAGVDYLSIYPGFAPLPKELAPLPSLNLSLGNNLRLISYKRAEARAEDRLAFTFYWEVSSTLPEETKLELSLIEGGDRVLQSETFELVDGSIESAEIPPQAIFRDFHSFAIAPKIEPGIYQLKLSLLSLEDKQANDSVILGEIKI